MAKKKSDDLDAKIAAAERDFLAVNYNAEKAKAEWERLRDVTIAMRARWETLQQLKDEK